jgi:hypothetical protein
MWEYWRRVGRRAVKDALALFDWERWKKLTVLGSVSVLAIIVGAYIATKKETDSNIESLISGVIASAAVFLLVLILYFIGTPHQLDRELRSEQNDRVRKLRSERDELDRKLRRWEDQRAVGHRLEELWKEGTKLKGDAQIEQMMEKAEPALVRIREDWKSAVIKWFEQLNSQERDNLAPNEQFMLETHSEMPKLNMRVIDIAQLLNVRLAKLRLVVNRCLTPPSS